jgi:hypothetical protein
VICGAGVPTRESFLQAPDLEPQVRAISFFKNRETPEPESRKCVSIDEIGSGVITREDEPRIEELDLKSRGVIPQKRNTPRYALQRAKGPGGDDV